MNCPTCAIPLHITERSGIEIDYCQKCRGVWLDRGELDKLIERAGTATQAPSYGNDGYDADERRAQGGGHKNGAHRREQENPIAELFDFF